MTPSRLRDVPLDDIPAAVAFYRYAKEAGLPLSEVSHGLLRLQTTEEGSEALALALALTEK